MAYAHLTESGWQELPAGQDIFIDGVQSSYATMLTWSDDERAARNIKTIVDDDVPAGKVATGDALADNAGAPRRVWTLEDAPPPPVPEEISDRQFAQGLATQGVITEDEALAWVGPGTVPPALLAFVDALPAEEQFGARMLLSGATIFRRSHPLTITFAAANGWTAGQTDDFWRFCGAL